MFQHLRSAVRRAASRPTRTFRPTLDPLDDRALPSATTSTDVQLTATHDTADDKFLIEAAESNQLGLMLSHQAAGRASTAAGRALAANLMTGYVQAQQALGRLIQSHGLYYSGRLSAEGQSLMAQLGQLQGESYDRAFVNAAIFGLRATIEQLMAQVNADLHSEFGAYAAGQLPGLGARLQAALQFRAQGGDPGEPDDGGIQGGDDDPNDHAGQDTQFLVQAAAANELGFQLATLAAQRGGSQAVRALGAQLAETYGEAQRQVRAALDRRGLVLDGQLGGAALQALGDFQRLRRAAFDRAFAAAVVALHQKALGEYAAAAQATADAQVTAYINAQLPVLAAQLQAAAQIQARLNAPALSPANLLQAAEFPQMSAAMARLEQLRGPQLTGYTITWW